MNIHRVACNLCRRQINQNGEGLLDGVQLIPQGPPGAESETFTMSTVPIACGYDVHVCNTCWRGMHKLMGRS